MTSSVPEQRQGTNGRQGFSGMSDVRRWADQQAGAPGGDATRHLCAAAHLDRDFRTQAIEELVEHRYRVPAPTPGTDVARVLEACLLARRAAVRQGTAILAIGVAGLLLSEGGVVLALFVLFTLRLAMAIAAHAPRGVRQDSRSLVLLRMSWSARLLVALPVAALLMAMVGGLLAVLLMALGQVSLASALGSGGGGGSLGGDSTPGTLSPSMAFGWTVLTVVLWIAVGTVHRYHRRRRMTAPPEAASDPPGAAFPSIAPVFQRLTSRITEGETVYGGKAAFVGSGVGMREEDWSYSIELRPSRERRLQNRPHDGLTVSDVHRLVARELAALGGGPLYPGDTLHRISVRDRVFRFGLRDRPAQEWLASLSRPDPRRGVWTLDPETVAVIDLASHERLRHYLEVRTQIWEEQVVASVFIRIHLQGGLLQMEGLPFVLPPVAARYRVVDEMLPPDLASDWPLLVGQAIAGLPRDVAGALLEPVAWLASMLRVRYRERWYRRMIAAGRPVQHGPNFSLRELGAEPEYPQRFQELDVDRYVQGVRRRAVSAVLKVLKQHGYETEEFEQIVNINNGNQVFGANHGAMNTGDNVHQRVTAPGPN
jgi:hypothetical protein